MSELLALCGADYRYPCGHQALRDVTWSLGPGRRVALLGGNGAGKSTLLLCLQGLLPLTRGELRLEGRRIGRDASSLRDLRSAVGLVFQDADDQLFAGDVAADVSYGPLNLGWSAARIRSAVTDLLTELGLSDLRDRPLHALSHGERKLVAIAGTLIMQPRVLLMDEPTAGLDGAGQAVLHTLLDRLHARGLSIVISTHDVDFAVAWADEVVVLKEGRLLAGGPPRAVLSQPELLRQAELAWPWAYAVAQRMWPDEPDWPRTCDAMLARLARVDARPGEDRPWR